MVIDRQKAERANLERRKKPLQPSNGKAIAQPRPQALTLILLEPVHPQPVTAAAAQPQTVLNQLRLSIIEAALVAILKPQSPVRIYKLIHKSRKQCRHIHDRTRK
jgi:hypothetical protein